MKILLDILIINVFIGVGCYVVENKKNRLEFFLLCVVSFLVYSLL